MVADRSQGSERSQNARLGEMEQSPCGFEREEKATGFPYLDTQPHEFVFRKMMEHHVRDEKRELLPSLKLQNIFLHPLPACRPTGGSADAVDSCELDAPSSRRVGKEMRAQGPISRSYLQALPGAGSVFGKPGPEPVEIPHQGVHSPQLASAPLCFGTLGIQPIDPLGLDDPFHRLHAKGRDCRGVRGFNRFSILHLGD